MRSRALMWFNKRKRHMGGRSRAIHHARGERRNKWNDQTGCQSPSLRLVVNIGRRLTPLHRTLAADSSSKPAPQLLSSAPRCVLQILTDFEYASVAPPTTTSPAYRFLALHIAEWLYADQRARLPSTSGPALAGPACIDHCRTSLCRSELARQCAYAAAGPAQVQAMVPCAQESRLLAPVNPAPHEQRCDMLECDRGCYFETPAGSQYWKAPLQSGDSSLPAGCPPRAPSPVEQPAWAACLASLAREEEYVLFV